MTEEAFTQAVQAHRDLLFRVAYTVLRNPEDCADALQEALEKAWRNLPSLRNPEAFRAWMVRIVLNASKGMLRKRKLQTVPLDNALPAPAVRDPALAEALAALEEGLRLPITLHYLENLTVAEIAQAMRLPQGTVKSRLFAARRKLAAYLKEEESL